MLRLLEYPRLAAALLGGGALIALIVVLVLLFIGGDGGPGVTFAYVADEADGKAVYFATGGEDDETLRLAAGLAGVSELKRSPAGGEIAFLASDAGGPALYRVAEAEEAELTRVELPGEPVDFVWSPDGLSFGYTVRESDGTFGLYVSGLDAATPTLLATSPRPPSLGNWSPDLQNFVYGLDGTGDDLGIFIKNPTGVNLIQLTMGADFNPTWSPDGDKIAFGSNRDGDTGQIYVVKSDGSELVSVSGVEGNNTEFSWSPDSNRLVFISDRTGNQEIFTVRSNGTDLEQLTSNSASESEPRWSDDGSQILFFSDNSGEGDIFTMNADGSSQRRISPSSSVREHLADW